LWLRTTGRPLLYAGESMPIDIPAVTHRVGGMTEITERLRSEHLQNERTIWIRQPRDLSARHLVIFLDGEFYRERVGALATVESLSLQGEVEDAWYVYVSSESAEARWRECPCFPPFARFADTELLPFLEERFPAIRHVGQRVIIGLSYTGLAAAYLSLELPNRFQKVISQSGSFWWNDCWVVESAKAKSEAPGAAFYLSVGQREIQQNIQHREGVLQVISQLEGVRRFRDALREKRVPVTYQEFDGHHEFGSWKCTLPDALRWALHPKNAAGSTRRA
jgi:enterochelin esterase-like enzyme